MEPRIDRPVLPEGYGVKEEGPYLQWEMVRARLSEATEYWLASTNPEGSPHVVPRWGVWIDDRFFYDGSPLTRHVRNVDHNPACVLHLESGTEVTIVEGRSVRSDPIGGDLGERLASEYARKYAAMGYSPEPSAWSDDIAGGMRILEPEKALAWSSFPTDLTRFRFPS